MFASILGLTIAVGSFKSQEPEMSVNDKGKARIAVGDSFNKAIHTRPAGLVAGRAPLRGSIEALLEHIQQATTPVTPPATSGGNSKP